jgi:hypothetical protein
VQIADFGTNYSGIGWITLVLPLVLLIIVIAWWRVSWSHGSSEAVDTFVESAPGTAATPTKRETTTTGGGDVAPVLVPIVPAAVLLPLGLAIAVAFAVVVLWWWQRARRVPS